MTKTRIPRIHQLILCSSNQEQEYRMIYTQVGGHIGITANISVDNLIAFANAVIKELITDKEKKNNNWSA